MTTNLTAAGAEVSFEALYIAFRPRIEGYIANRLPRRDSQLAEDITSEVFLSLWRSHYAPGRQVDVQRPWGLLATVASRRIADHFRLARNVRETPTDTGHYSFANREMETGAGYYTPAATGFRTATWSDDDPNAPWLPKIPGPRKPSAANGDVCPLCEYFRCRCKSAQAAAHPGDSDPNPDEALRRVQGKPAPTRPAVTR